uniref:DNA binding protein n=1 Tax=Rhizophora mucronata TaxID=61149 RepID=A0A2P2JL84_RHIMU
MNSIEQHLDDAIVVSIESLCLQHLISTILLLNNNCNFGKSIEIAYELQENQVTTLDPELGLVLREI